MKRVCLFAAACVTLYAVGCKKDSSSTTDSATTAQETALATTSQTNAYDQARLQGDDDELSFDVTKAINGANEFGGANNTTGDSASVDGAVVDRSQLAIKRLKIKYLGLGLLGVTKTGTITVELVAGNKWADAGATIKQTFDSVTVTKGGKKLLFQGVRYITNVKGGYYQWSLLTGDTVVYKVRASGSVTFESGAVRTWWAARLNKYAYNKTNVSLYFSSSGDTTVAGSKCSMGGISRFGNAFLVKAPSNIQMTNSLSCYNKPSSGVRIFESDNKMVTITYGVDGSGTPVSSGCAYGYKIEWTKINGKTGTAIISY